MGLVINTNIAAINATRILRGSSKALSRSLERLASGLRINRAADDAAGLAVAEGFRSQVRGLQVAQRNAQDGISFVQTAEGALSQVTAILQRMRELAVQSANGTLSNDNRAALEVEVKALRDEITEIFRRTTFNGTNVGFNTAGGNALTLQVGPNEGSATGNEISLTIKEINTIGTVADTNILTNLGLVDADLDFATNVAATDITTASEAITIIDDAITTISTTRSALGAIQNRLDFTIEVLAIQEENSAAAESAIRDANIAVETIAFTRNQILVASGTAILAQANLVPQTALQLLG